MKIPKSIDPCPIIEAIVEIRFKTKTPIEVILGVIYNEFKEDYPKLEKLPILQIPENIRAVDPNLINKPCYKLLGKKFFIQVGPKILSIVNSEKYLGWQLFSEKIYNLFKRAFDLFEIDHVERAAVRYVNLFKDMNIFEYSNLNISLREKNLFKNEINITTKLNSETCTHRLVMVNHAEVIMNNKSYRGSLIDIDTVIKNCPSNLHKEIESFRTYIEKAHVEEKELFYKLISDNLLQSLNPKY